MAKSLSELKVKTSKLLEAGENAGSQTVIRFCFESDWLRKWKSQCGPIALLRDISWSVCFKNFLVWSE